jgi:hypothetical protein
VSSNERAKGRITGEQQNENSAVVARDGRLVRNWQGIRAANRGRGINVVLLARREALLEEVGRDIASDFKVDYRALAVDLSQEGFVARLAEATVRTVVYPSIDSCSRRPCDSTPCRI